MATPAALPDPAQGSPAPNADPPVEAPGTTAPDWDSDDNPYKARATEWESRFDSYRRGADRNGTELSSLKQAVADLNSDDPQKRSAAAELLGVEFVEPEPETYDDPLDAQQARIDALERELQQLGGTMAERDQERQRDLVARQVEARMDELKIDEADRDWVLARAIMLDPADDGLPNIQAAFDELSGRDRAAMERWRKSKAAPTSIRPGATATPTKAIHEMVDPQTGLLTQEGLDHLAEQAEARAQV